MAEPVIAQRAPIPADVVAGKSYWWCACGQSRNQPFCDGSHKGGAFAPFEYKAMETKTVWFCACKNTKNAPLCDGTHKTV